MSMHEDYRTLLQLLRRQAAALQAGDLNLLNSLGPQVANLSRRVEAHAVQLPSLDPAQRADLRELIQKILAQVAVNQEWWQRMFQSHAEQKEAHQATLRYFTSVRKQQEPARPRFTVEY